MLITVKKQECYNSLKGRDIGCSSIFHSNFKFIAYLLVEDNEDIFRCLIFNRYILCIIVNGLTVFMNRFLNMR
uniref:Uncharacterized protein n=1 Tax=Lactuca sativa TaxID=4236 RepID=A0A9R1UC56_LACSA|nr:hypothetical protein LSAT_V11C000506770 [Lactuca sativa]